MSHDDTIAFLNHLAAINRNAQAALHTAAESVHNSELESLFTGYAKQHARFLSEIETELERLGGKPEHSGKVGGALEKGWQDLKAAVTGHSPAALLSSCESQELSAEVAYDDAIKGNPTGQTHKLIEHQREQIKGFHTRLARLVGETKDGIDFQQNE